MRITISSGKGQGPTPLAAFDAALIEAGVANYNLICLSSVIPAGSVLTRDRFVSRDQDYGDRLYVVMVRRIETRKGRAAWAGLGWTQEKIVGRGLFVELCGASKGNVKKAISRTLAAMIANRSIVYGPIETEIAGIVCRQQPVCALVIAVYQTEGWNG